MYEFQLIFHWRLLLRVQLTTLSVQIMAWRRPSDKPLSEPMMVSLLTHICVTRPKWVNPSVDNWLGWNYFFIPNFNGSALGYGNEQVISHTLLYMCLLMHAGSIHVSNSVPKCELSIKNLMIKWPAFNFHREKQYNDHLRGCSRNQFEALRTYIPILGFTEHAQKLLTRGISE